MMRVGSQSCAEGYNAATSPGTDPLRPAGEIAPEVTDLVLPGTRAPAESPRSDHWALTAHDDVRYASKHPEIFSSGAWPLIHEVGIASKGR